MEEYIVDCKKQIEQGHSFSGSHCSDVLSFFFCNPDAYPVTFKALGGRAWIVSKEYQFWYLACKLLQPVATHISQLLTDHWFVFPDSVVFILQTRLLKSATFIAGAQLLNKDAE